MAGGGTDRERMAGRGEGGDEGAGAAKSRLAFRTISEVSDELGVPQHVLRFWETRFSQVQPMKRGGGRRLYRPDHLALLHGIRALLHDDGMTIKGVQKMLREQGVKAVVARGASEGPLPIAPPADAPERLSALRQRLSGSSGSDEAAGGGVEGAGAPPAPDSARLGRAIARLETALDLLESAEP